MQNKHHIDLLKKSVEEWNSFRVRNKTFLPDLEGADLKGGDLKRANLEKANLQKASLQKSILRNANLYDANLEGARLWDADVSNADIQGANFKNAQLDGLKFNKNIKSLGAKVEACRGNPRFKRLVMENEYIEATKHDYPFWSKIWFITSDYGRSPLRLSLFGCAIIASFALIYGLYPDLIHWPNQQSDQPELSESYFMPIYYSIVVFSTLGDSAISPANLYGQIVVCMEVLLGYIWLGVFVSVIVRRVLPGF